MNNELSLPARPIGNALLAFALTMPCLQAAQAESVPEQGLISYKYLDYQDSQPGEERVGVQAHSLLVMTPFAEHWSIKGSLTADSVSGASPRLWTRSAASMSDERRAGDLTLTRYFERDTLALTLSHSDENDYTSRSLGLTASHASEDHNTTLSLGIGFTDDENTAKGLDEGRNSVDIMAGISQVLTPTDIVQFTLTHVLGHGYYSDPYKQFDHRPGHKQQSTGLVRWNHFLEGPDATLRMSYRYYTDTWSIHAHTFDLAYVQPLAGGWTLTPSVRIHDQSAAEFFTEPGSRPNFAGKYSADHRLSAFGAHTMGLKIAKSIDHLWTVDLKYEYYQQRAGWRLFGDGSPGMEPLRARFIQFGLSRTL